MSALTVADIKIRVKRIFGDESGVQLDDSDILRMINDAQRDIAERNDSVLEKSATANCTAGIQEYTLPTDLMRFKFLSFKGSAGVGYQPLQGMTLNEFNLYIDSWDSNTVSRADPAVYALHSGNFLVFPIPDETIASAFKIYYNRRPVDVALDADVIDLPERYHSLVRDSILQQAYEMDENWEAASAKSNQNNVNLDRLRSGEEWTKKDTYPVITVRPEDY